ncbi:hypothetical protein SLEP1_g32365 [Rubroshorea leprosula]|uniref:DUF4283 domain-containing protein n=1 Tax=Rubroshorea leprosula TaxID=152421 RepID=A0AAV5KD23_9ROSI|nr:hypothetical protein SLEP1_g32365 [Rubroshorea leprosula]
MLVRETTHTSSSLQELDLLDRSVKRIKNAVLGLVTMAIETLGSDVHMSEQLLASSKDVLTDTLMGELNNKSGVNKSSSYKDKLLILENPIALTFSMILDYMDEESNVDDDLDDDSPVVFLSKVEKQRIHAPWINALIIRAFYHKPLDDVDLHKVIFGGPWFVGPHYLTMRRWAPNFVPFEALHSFTTTTIWAQLPNLLTDYYDLKTLQKIAQLGISSSGTISKNPTLGNGVDRLASEDRSQALLSINFRHTSINGKPLPDDNLGTQPPSILGEQWNMHSGEGCLLSSTATKLPQSTTKTMERVPDCSILVKPSDSSKRPKPPRVQSPSSMKSIILFTRVLSLAQTQMEMEYEVIMIPYHFPNAQMVVEEPSQNAKILNHNAAKETLGFHNTDLCSMKIMAWNCHGAANQSFIHHFRDLRNTHSLVMMLISETKLARDRAMDIASKLYSSYHIVDAEGFARGLWLL